MCVYVYQVLLDVLLVHQRIIGLEVPVVENEDGEFVRVPREQASEVLSFESLCLRDGAQRCVVRSPLAAWDYDRFRLANDNDTLATLNAALPEPNIEQNLGGAQYETGVNSTQRVVSARAVRFFYFLANRAEVRDGSLVDARADAWEQAVLNITRPDRATFDRVQVFPSLQRSQADVSSLTIGMALIIVYTIIMLGNVSFFFFLPALLQN